MRRLGKSFIDANVLQIGALYRNSEIYNWLNQLYSTLYVHISVLDECLISQVRYKVEEMIQQQGWILFDPDQFRSFIR
jgi:hypothetical protein